MWPLIGDLLPHAPHGGEVGGNDWSVQSSRHWRRPLEDIPSLALSWRPHCMRSWRLQCTHSLLTRFAKRRTPKIQKWFLREEIIADTPACFIRECWNLVNNRVKWDLGRIMGCFSSQDNWENCSRPWTRKNPSSATKGFVASPQQLQKQFGHVAPDWRFIAPRSPWWGGWWERLIRSIKSSLKKTFGRHSLTRTELETTLHEVESCVNSRPLTYVSDEANAESPLTPAHFLLGHAGGFYERSTPTPVASGSDLALRFAMRESLLDKFWEIWSSDYIRNLPPWRGAQGKCDLREGSVVLVQDDQQPRLRWPLGVITQLFPGRDGVVRTVEVKTASGKLVRSIPRIHDLEILSGSVDDVPGPMPSVYPPETAPRPKGQYVTSKGRVVKPVQRLDL